MVVAALVVLPYAHTYTHLSPFDELVHVDYMVKAQHGELVNGGELIGQTAMREQACRGHDIESMSFPPCRTKVFDPTKFPEKGYNTAFPDPPVYYWVTAPLASVVDELPGVDSVVTAGRAVGVLWLGGGLALTFLLCLRLGANRVAAFGVTLAVAATPVVAHSTATITSDAPQLMAGAGLCLAALAVTRRRLSLWWLVLGTGLAAGVKATSLVIVGLVVVFLLLELVRGRGGAARTGSPSVADGDENGDEDGLAEDAAGDAPAGRMTPAQVLRAVAAVAVATGVVFAGWAAVGAATSMSAVDQIPMREAYRVDTLTWPNIAVNILPLLSPVQQGYQPAFMAGITIALLMAAFNLLLVAGVIGAAWGGWVRTEVGRLGIATVAAMVLSGPALVVVIYLGSHSYIPIPFRYGLGLVPPAVACLAVLASRRPAGGVALALLGAGTLLALLNSTL